MVEELNETKCLLPFHPHGLCAFSIVVSILQNSILYNFNSFGTRPAIALQFLGLFMKWNGMKAVAPS